MRASRKSDKNLQEIKGNEQIMRQADAHEQRQPAVTLFLHVVPWWLVCRVWWILPQENHWKIISAPVVFCLCTGVMIVRIASSNGMMWMFYKHVFPCFLFKYF